MRMLACILTLVVVSPLCGSAQGPTEEDLTMLIGRLIELDSIDLAPRV